MKDILSQVSGATTCDNIKPPPSTVIDANKWQPVIDKGTYVFSAFYDARGRTRGVRVIGISNGDISYRLERKKDLNAPIFKYC